LYNGEDKYPDKNTLRLSDMFAQYGEKGTIELELEVKVYNINKGHNPELAKKSVTLNGYEEFIAAVRDYEKQGLKREAAITQAVKDCINRNILKDFLETNSSEVINMLLTDWNMDDALRVREEEGILIGEQRGMRIGEQRGMLIGEQRGMRHGMQERAKEIARNMLNKGMDVDTIASITGLFVDDVLRLQNE